MLLEKFRLSLLWSMLPTLNSHPKPDAHVENKTKR